MEACVSHDAALRWLLGNPNPLATGQGHPRAGALPSRAPTDEEADALAHAAGAQTVDVLVRDKSGMRKTDRLHAHLETRTLPGRSLIRMEAFTICSPELVFLQVAATSDLPETIACGCALCSAYRLDASARGGARIREHGDAPLTSTQRIAHYLELCDGVRGVARARRALRYVVDNSFSPMESGIAMCLSLPLNLGGHALGDVVLNPKLKVRVGTDAHGRRVYETRRPDLLVTRALPTGERRQAAVDFDSVAVHSSRRDHARDAARDAARRNELQSSLGMPHFTLAGSQATDYVAFCRFIDLVRISLGQRRKDFSRGGGERDRKRLENVRHRQFELWLRFVSGAARTIGH